MSDETERTEGYVIRWPWGGEPKQYQYAASSIAYAVKLEAARIVWTLADASRLLLQRSGHSGAEIVRVRRVEGESVWKRMPDGLYRVGPSRGQEWEPSNYESRDGHFSIERQEPGERRWEVVEGEARADALAPTPTRWTRVEP
mgnify:FL=1